jgi:hypothetical protein
LLSWHLVTASLALGQYDRGHGPDDRPAGRVVPHALVPGNRLNGSQLNRKFTVIYSDGTRQTLTQSMSDWSTPQGYGGESTAVKTAYRVRANATVDARPFYLYGYSFALDSSKAVKSITLPNNGNVTLTGMTLS